MARSRSPRSTLSVFTLPITNSRLAGKSSVKKRSVFVNSLSFVIVIVYKVNFDVRCALFRIGLINS